jgi:hypothetical protein
VSRFIKATQEYLLAMDELRDYSVNWLRIEDKDVNRLKRRLRLATAERDMQRFLEEHPIHLILHLGGGHGRWVIPQKKLGSEYVTDFVIGQKHSGGFEWEAVELESPSVPMFTKAGDPSRQLIHAIRQIQDWRRWLGHNQNYAAHLRRKDGLGLTEIRCDLPGLILIGRRDAVDPKTNGLRQQMAKENAIKIHTYDFLIDNSEGQAEVWKGLSQSFS